MATAYSNFDEALNAAFDGLQEDHIGAIEPDRRLFVVAGNRKQYEMFIRSKGLRDVKDSIYVSRSEGLHGVSNATIVFTGTWSGRDDIDDILELVRVLEVRSPYQCKIEYQPLIP